MLDRRGTGAVERAAELASRERARTLARHALVVGLAPACLVGDHRAGGLDERVDALRQRIAAVIETALGELAGHDGWEHANANPVPTSCSHPDLRISAPTAAVENLA